MIRGRIADIELLRGIAVLLVVLHHANGSLVRFPSQTVQGLYQYFGGWVGVDLFFAISGFVIARSLLPDLYAAKSVREHLGVSLRFWVRRVYRLFPAAWTWLLLILLLQLFFNQSGVFGSFRANLEGLIAGVLQVANLRFVFSFGQAPMGASFHYWSLSLEEQFYLLLPLACLLNRRWLIGLLVLLIAVQFMQARGLWLMMFRSDAIGLGVLLALFSSTSQYRRWRPVWLARPWCAVPVFAASVLGLVLLASPHWKGFSYHVGAIALISAALTWIASYNADYLGRWLPGSRLLVWVGSRSYGIYLMHIPVMYTVREIWYRLGLEPKVTVVPMLLCCMVLLVLLAEASFRWIENPLRLRGQRIATRL